MSRAVELAGFALFVLAAYTLWGPGPAELVGGVELVLVAQALEGVNVARSVRDLVQKAAARIARGSAPPAQ